MAQPWVLDFLQEKLSYPFKDLSLLKKTLVAGDSNSNDYEGHRGMAQLGDSLMGTVIMSDGLERGLSRNELQSEALWEDLSRRMGDGSDCFIVKTPCSVAQHTPRKGNPRNIARTNIAQGFSDSLGSECASSEIGEVHKNTRLRRLGQRLGLIVRTWGQGVLLMLGQDLSESSILATTDQAFEAVIRLMNEYEGTRISAISTIALPILQDFRRGDQTTARLRLESADELAILRISRLSAGFEALLKPLDEE
ncbi:hypothetical protein LTR86_011152 [Recurvomyces mirabilis]|nr:hypothetical protein LTR86_011152 [Recurvomyces mirabilis]